MHILNAHLRPIFAHLRFPLAQLRRGSATVAGKILVRSGGGNVEPLRIFFHHPVRVESRRDAANCFAHQLQPGEGKFAIRFRVIKWDDLIFEQLIKTARIHFVLKLDRAVVDLGANRPAVVAVITFAPPAIEGAEVDPGVRRQFHSARAARFQRAKRMVEPQIDTLHETAGDVTVVVFDEDDAVPEACFAAEFVDLLDERFAGFITGMRFACENKLHRPRRVVEQSMQPFLVAK